MARFTPENTTGFDPELHGNLNRQTVASVRDLIESGFLGDRVRERYEQAVRELVDNGIEIEGGVAPVEEVRELICAILLDKALPESRAAQVYASRPTGFFELRNHPHANAISKVVGSVKGAAYDEVDRLALAAVSPKELG